MEWRKCPSLEGHEVSEYGHLRRVVDVKNHTTRYPAGREYSYGLAGKGYAFYNVKVEDKRKNFYAHRLVAEAFIGVCPAGHQVAHTDGDKLNCHYSNLRYATAKQNNADKLLHGTRTDGDKNPMVKMTTDEASFVFEMREKGVSQKQIGEMFSVSQRTIGRFIKRVTA